MRCGTRGVDLPCDVSGRFSRVSCEVEPVERRMPQSCSKSRRDSPNPARADAAHSGCRMDSWTHESAPNFFLGIFCLGRCPILRSLAEKEWLKAAARNQG